MEKSMSNDKDTILVTGATGNVGRRLVAQLLRAGVRIRGLTRNPDSAGLPDGVEVVRGELSVPATLEASLNGVGAGVDVPPMRWVCYQRSLVGAADPRQ